VPDLTDIPDLGSGLLSIIIRSAVIYGFLVVALRIGGKREVGQLTTPDLVVLLIVSNAVQNAMVGENTTLLGGVVAAITIFILARLTQVAIDRFGSVERALVGEPRILATDGVVNPRAMKDEEIDMTDLSMALREHGLEDMADAHLIVLEVDGSISVVPVDPDKGGGGGPGQRRAGHLPRRSRRVGRRGRAKPG
jgi:uncharacterized membrane protein YcaP (DUF421 family)